MTVKRIEKGNEEVKLNSDVHNLTLYIQCTVLDTLTYHDVHNLPLYIQCTVLATLTYRDVHNLPLYTSVQCWIR